MGAKRVHGEQARALVTPTEGISEVAWFVFECLGPRIKRRLCLLWLAQCLCWLCLWL